MKMVMQMLRLYDQIDIEKTQESGIFVRSNLSFLPTDERNIAYKAAKVMIDQFGLEQGVIIRIEKHIPVAAGMAGGSTDCAAVLYGMNKLFGLRLNQKKLRELGVKLGADVPYCLMRQTALSEGIGEILTPISPLQDCPILIAKPSVSVSTRHVYEHLKLDEQTMHPDIDGIVTALADGDLYGVTDRMANVLETVTVPEHPVIDEIKKQMMASGAVNALMSGSGPTVFGIFDDEEKEVGRMKDFEMTIDEYLPLRDVVFNTLRRAILKGELEPGERLMEIALANKLGVSRTPIREAIRKLELEGLVVMIPRKGAEVARITEKDLRDVLEVRTSLEKLAIELACDRITEEDINDLNLACKDFEESFGKDDLTTIAEKDVAFHDIIFRATKNARLIQILNNLREQMYRYRLEYLKDTQSHGRLVEEHQKIVNAIIEKNKEEAVRLIQEHIYIQELTVIKKIQEQEN